MEHEDVAIIGAACLLPEADSLDTFHENLRKGQDSVGQPSVERIHHSGGSAGTDYLFMGYLDRVDLFDHRFFGISLREAELMDPHQRLVLQLTHQALENACYAPGNLRGSRTAVILSEPRSQYDTLFQDSDPQQILGALPAALAARVSYLFDFLGPALVVDTACSSGLVAVAQAVEKLRVGAVRMAIAGGVSVQPVLLPLREYQPLRGVESPDGRCRPFDALANGAVGGEGGGIVVLKLLADALADGDNIQAVLKGIAVNHNGYRAASMSAPSQLAQAEVITEAWGDAGVPAATVGYVECHGSATALGDVVEVEGLRRAFLDAGVDEPQCAIGSVKGNIGHLDNAAGLAGLFKAMLSVQRGVLYPTAHFAMPNPLIDFSGPVYVNTVERAWNGATGSPRRAGLSSFGLSGTNVHAVVEQVTATVPPAAAEQDSAGELVTVSAKSSTALQRYCQRLVDFLERTEHSLRTVAHAMNRGRDDYPYRLAVSAGNKQELTDALRSSAIPDRAVDRVPVVLLFSGDGRLDEPSWSRLCAAHPELEATVSEVLSGLGTTSAAQGTSAARMVAQQYALCRLTRSLGLDDTRFVGSGTGSLVVRMVQGELSPSDGVRVAAGAEISTDVDRARLRQVVAGFRRDGAVFVEVGLEGTLSRETRRLAPDLRIVELAACAGPYGVLGQLGVLYELGATIDWHRYYESADLARIEAPSYPFEPVRCWCRPAGVPLDAPATEEAASGGSVRTEPPASADTEQRIAAAWAQVLKHPDVRPDSDYFALGGTSIAGITVLRQMERDFDVELTFADLYAHPTVRSLAELVGRLRSEEREAPHLPIAAIPRGGALPLSFGQEQLWYLDQLNPDSPLYNIPVDLRLRGPMDRAAFEGALRDLIARHEVLRTCVRSDDGEPYALVLADEPELVVIDLSSSAGADRDRQARRIIEAEATRPFDLARGPLIRATLLKLTDDDHVLLCTHHHIVFDGWSPTVFFRDFAELYQARVAGRPPNLPELPIQYADFAAWQRSWLTGERLERGLGFWRDQLRDLQPGELPLDRPRPAMQTFSGDLVEFTIDAELAGRVRRFSQQHSVTTFVTMLAVVNALLHRWAHLEDVVVGVGTSGRGNPSTHGLIGYFNNLPPFRTRVSGDLRFGELVKRCATTVAGVLDHEEVPFEKIVSALCRRRDPARHPLFDVAYTYQNVPQELDELAGLRISRYLDGQITGIAPGTAKFDLTFGIIDQDDGPMHGYVEYAAALFEQTTMRRLAERLPTLVGSAMDDPDQRIDELPEASARPAAPRPSAPRARRAGWMADRLAVEMVAAQAAERPDHPAVVCGERGYTRREINRMANRLAGRLIDGGVAAEAPVPVIADRGAELVVGWLAVAKAGGACVPIDPSAPHARIEAIVAELGAPIVVAGQHPPPAGARRVGIDLTGTSEADDESPSRRAPPEALAYVAYTSGSTGRPHGCGIENRNLLHLARWYRDEVGLSADDQVLQSVSPGFDAAVLELWPALCCGATVHFAPTSPSDPQILLRWMAERRITVAFVPTPLAEVVLSDCELPEGLRLRLMCTGGDELRVRPRAGCPFRLVNMYGPTECTVVSTAGDVAPVPDSTVPDIGRPVANTQVHLLDARGLPVAASESGEIHIGGAAVGRGYCGLAGLTATRFVADPFAAEPGARMYRTGDLGRWRPDGTVEFCGRLDDQVEVRGQRVEPTEIERALGSHPTVREALVVAARPASGSVRLVAYVTGNGSVPTEDELLAWAARVLPAYMVPSRVVVLDSLPRTANGKLDRKGVRQMTISMTTPAAVSGGEHGEEPEWVLARLCAELLALDRVDPGDSFFELGGDSVLGVRMAHRAAKAGIHFTPQQLLQCHTLRELAAVAAVADTATDTATATYVDTTATTATYVDTATVADAATVAPPQTPIPLTPIMYEFLDRLPPGARDFVEVHALDTAAHVDGDAVRAAVEHVVALHEPLRYRFRHNGLGWRINCRAVETSDLFDVKVLPPMTAQQELAVVEEDCRALKTQINLQSGPVLRVRFYDRGRNRGSLILLLIHHFVFDNMATVVLVDDLDAALADLTARRPLRSRPRPAAWREWAEHLRNMASSDEVAAELTYWTGILQTGAAMAAAGGADRPAGGAVVGREVGAGRVAAVLKDSGPESREAAMCALACGLARWGGTPGAYVMTEGNATPNVYRLAGRGPSVGWFTSLHPLLLPVNAGASVGESLPEIVDRIRSVPNDGLGYGILRHLTPDSPPVAELRSLREPEAMVLHGPHDFTALDAGVRLLRTRRDLCVNLKGEVATRCFPLMLSTGVVGDSLHLVAVSDGRFDRLSLESLAEEVARAFAELADVPSDPGRD